MHDYLPVSPTIPGSPVTRWSKTTTLTLCFYAYMYTYTYLFSCCFFFFFKLAPSFPYHCHFLLRAHFGNTTFNTTLSFQHDFTYEIRKLL